MPQKNGSLLKIFPKLVIDTSFGVSKAITIGLTKSIVKIATINIPSYLIYFASDQHKVPEGQEHKVITALKASSTMHVINTMGSEVANFLSPTTTPINGVIFLVIGCAMQAKIGGKDTMSGVIRGSSYSLLGMNAEAVYMTEALYSSSDAVFKELSSDNRNFFDIGSKALNAGIKSIESSFYLYSTVQAIHLPIVYSKKPLAVEILMQEESAMKMISSSGDNIINLVHGGVDFIHAIGFLYLATKVNGTYVNEVVVSPMRSLMEDTLQNNVINNLKVPFFNDSTGLQSELFNE